MEPTKASGLTGSWYDPSTSGQGLVLHPIDDSKQVVSMFSYTENGDPLWLIGTVGTPLQAGTSLLVQMQTATGGTFETFDPGNVSLEEWGTLVLNFTNCSTARALLIGQSGTQTMALTKLTGVLGSGCQLPDMN